MQQEEKKGRRKEKSRVQRGGGDHPPISTPDVSCQIVICSDAPNAKKLRNISIFMRDFRIFLTAIGSDWQNRETTYWKIEVKTQSRSEFLCFDFNSECFLQRLAEYAICIHGASMEHRNFHVHSSHVHYFEIPPFKEV